MKVVAVSGAKINENIDLVIGVVIDRVGEAQCWRQPKRPSDLRRELRRLKLASKPHPSQQIIKK